MTTIKLSQRDQKILDELVIKYPNGAILTNPYSGQEVVLSGRDAALVLLIKDLERTFNKSNDFSDTTKKGRETRSIMSKFDNCRYLLMKLNPEAYYDLID